MIKFLNFAVMKRNSLPFQRIDLNILENRISANGNLMSYTDRCGFFLCQRGYAKISINGHVIAVNAGDVYLYLPATYVYVMETSPDLKGITYKSTMNYVMSLISESRYTHDIMSLRDNPCISLRKEQQTSIEELVNAMEVRQKMMEEAANEDCNKIMLKAIYKLAESLIHEIIFYFLSSGPSFELKSDRKDYVLQCFLESLMEGYKDNREVSYYAQLQSLSPRYFSSIIKEKSGKTPQQWIIQMVINSIKQTLIYTPKSIKEIADEFHFATQSFMGKYFKEYVGVSPKEFRARNLTKR